MASVRQSWKNCPICTVGRTKDDKKPCKKCCETPKPKVGMKVMANGFPGVITAVCDWAPSMVEVQLERGGICVAFSDCVVV